MGIRNAIIGDYDHGLSICIHDKVRGNLWC